MPDPFFPGNDPLPPDKSPPTDVSKSGRGYGALFAALNLIFIMAGTTSILIYSPAHSIASFLYVALLTAPLSLPLFMVTRSYARRGSEALYGTVTSRQKLNKLTWGLGILIVVVGLFDMANAVLDPHPVVETAYTVIDTHKWHRRHSINSYNYEATIVLPEATLSPFLDIKLRIYCLIGRTFSKVDLCVLPGAEQAKYIEDVPITQQEFSTLRPSLSRLYLDVHPGFLGLIWYEHRHRIAGDNDQPARQVENKVPNPQRLADALSRRAESLSHAMLLTFTASSSVADKAILDHADLTLSHLRWEYVYNDLAPDIFTVLVQKLENLVKLGIPSGEAEINWEHQVNAVIADNRVQSHFP